MAEFLLDRGANIEAANAVGLTAVMFAQLKNHSETVALLLARGAMRNIVTAMGAMSVSEPER
jgi:ankyrin repeat protein